jgi:hypothetical protein
MKSIFYCLFFFLFAQTSFAQEANLSAISLTTKELVKSKELGVFEFTFPTQITKENIQQSAQFYTSYFTVNFSEPTHKVTISMIENNSLNRRIIMRFLATNNISTISIEGTSISTQEFYEKYLD